MAGPDPTCLVNGSVAPYDATASSTITITLNNPAGVRYWSVLCTATDELDTPGAVNATLTINQTTKTATCTLSAVLGAAYIFTSQVGINGLGLDANSVLQPSFSTNFKVNVKAANTARVLAENETFEQSAAAGWVAVVNPALRAGVGVPTTVGGTGFAHVTGGVIDANARAVNLASNGVGGDVTGLLAAINGGRLQGDLNVTHAAPGTFDATHQVAYCDTSTGTCSVTFPPASAFPGSVIPADWQLLVVDTGGAAATSAITVNPNGESTWNPSTGTFVTSNITLGGTPTTNGIAALWQWDSNKSHWVFINASSSGSAFGTVGNGAAVVTTTYTLASTDFHTLIAAGAQVTGPAVPILGATYRLTSASGEFDTAPAKFIGNGYNVYDPNPTTLYANGASVALKVSGAVYAWWWDGTVMRLAA